MVKVRILKSRSGLPDLNKNKALLQKYNTHRNYKPHGIPGNKRWNSSSRTGDPRLQEYWLFHALPMIFIDQPILRTLPQTQGTAPTSWGSIYRYNVFVCSIKLIRLQIKKNPTNPATARPVVVRQEAKNRI